MTNVLEVFSEEQASHGTFASYRLTERDRLRKTAQTEALNLRKHKSKLSNQNKSLAVWEAAEKRLPMVVHARGWVEKGGLFSYGHDQSSVGLDAAVYVDKIIQGAKQVERVVYRLARALGTKWFFD